MRYQSTFTITSTPTGLAMAGELDIAGTSRLSEIASAWADSDLTLDVRALTFIDCAGLDSVVGIHHRLRAAHHRLTICQAPRRIRRVFALAGLHDLLEPRDDVNNTILHSPAMPQPVCSAATNR